MYRSRSTTWFKPCRADTCEPNVWIVHTQCERLQGRPGPLCENTPRSLVAGGDGPGGQHPMHAMRVPAALSGRIERNAVRGAVRPGRRPRDGVIDPGVSRRGVAILTPNFEEQLDTSRRARRAQRGLMIGERVTWSHHNGHATATESASSSHQRARIRSQQVLPRRCNDWRHNLGNTSQDSREPLPSRLNRMCGEWIDLPGYTSDDSHQKARTTLNMFSPACVPK